MNPNRLTKILAPLASCLLYQVAGVEQFNGTAIGGLTYASRPTCFLRHRAHYLAAR